MSGLFPRILLLGIVCSPPGAWSESPSSSASDLTGRVLAAIEVEQARNGQYSENLIEPLDALIQLYLANGSHRLAAAAIERALQVVRANYGVHALEQVSLIHQSIRIEEAIGNAAGAWDREQELVALTKRHPEDMRRVPILRDLSERRMDLLDDYMAGEFPPQIILGCYYKPSPYGDFGSCTAGRKGDVVRSILSEVRGNRLDAIDTLLRHGSSAAGELRELELDIVRNVYLYQGYLSLPLAHYLSAPRPHYLPVSAHTPYKYGRERLERLVEYESGDPGKWQNRIDALVRVADWDLLFSHNGLALDQYAEIYAELEQAGMTEPLIEEIFDPDTPIVLPSFLPNPLASKEADESVGHIDISFDITKFGVARRVRIMATTTNATKDAKDRLVRLIRGSRFRPRLIDGQAADKNPIVVRYYISG